MFKYGKPKFTELKFAEVKRNAEKEWYGVISVEGNKGGTKSFLVTYPSKVRSVAVDYFTREANKMKGTVTTVGVF